MKIPAPPLERLRKLVKEDPRSAILLHEIIGPPPGLRPIEKSRP